MVCFLHFVGVRVAPMGHKYDIYYQYYKPVALTGHHQHNNSR